MNDTLALLLVSLTAFVSLAPLNLSTRAVIEAKFAAVNRHALDDIVSLYAPDARISSSGFCGPRQGRADVARTYQSLIGSFPDISAEVAEWVVQGDRVAVLFTTRMRIQGKPYEVQIAKTTGTPPTTADTTASSPTPTTSAGRRWCTTASKEHPSELSRS